MIPNQWSQSMQSSLFSIDTEADLGEPHDGVKAASLISMLDSIMDHTPAPALAPTHLDHAVIEAEAELEGMAGHARGMTVRFNEEVPKRNGPRDARRRSAENLMPSLDGSRGINEPTGERGRLRYQDSGIDMESGPADDGSPHVRIIQHIGTALGADRREHDQHSTPLFTIPLNQSKSTDLSSNEVQTALQRDVLFSRRGVACAFCRRRKLRCSRDRPVCLNCSRYAQSCEYLTTNEAPGIEPINLTDTGLFTTTPLPPSSGRPIPQTIPRGLRKQSSLRPPERIVQLSNFLTSAKKQEDVWGQRPSLTKNTSASERPSLLSPSTTPLVHYHDPATAEHIGRRNGIATGTVTGTREQTNDITRHCVVSVPLVSPAMPPSKQLSMTIPVHHEQVTPIPPLIQYPVEDRTAWNETALNINHRQLCREAFHLHAPQYQYAPNRNITIQDVTPQRYHDPGFGIAGVPGTEARYAGLPGHGWPNPFMGYPAGPDDTHDGYWDASMDHTDLGTGYSQTPGPYASQANLPIHTAPTPIPIYQHIQYITPAIDVYRPGVAHEGLHIPSNQEFPYRLPPGCD